MVISSPAVGKQLRAFRSRRLAGLRQTAHGAGKTSGSRRATAPVQPRAQADYAAIASDSPVLQQPLRQELAPEDILNVFNFPNQLDDRYRLGNVLGAGSFGVVRECVEVDTALRYAVKTISKTPKRGKPTPRYLLKLQQEVDAMQQVGASLDAVYLKDVFEDEVSIHLVMEVCDGGPLLDRLQRSKTSERHIATLVRSITRFISQCHARGLIYRDVKPDNFLFMSEDDASPLKATDFGLSIRHTPEEPPLKSRSGTPAYMAPEVILQHYTEKADVWSVGMLTYQLLTGRFPFTDNIRKCSLQQVWSSILTEPIDFEELHQYNLSGAAQQFLKATLHREPEARVSAAEALKLPFLKDSSTLPDMPLGGTVVARLQRFATYSHLKQMVLRMITEELSANLELQQRAVPEGDKEDVQRVFTALDADGSGDVSLDELTQGLEAQGYNLTKEEAHKLMQRMDVNRDGGASMVELAASLIDWADVLSRLQKGDWDKLVDMAFDRMDEDGNGFITIDELLHQMQTDNPSGDQDLLTEAQRMLRDADSNGDGLISRQEFHALLRDSMPDMLENYDTRIGLTVVDEDLRDIDDVEVTEQR